MKKRGYDIHGLKRKKSSRRDIFVDRKGELFMKPKSGSGPGEPLNININNL